MPATQQILHGLTIIANQWLWLAVAWHVCFAVLVVILMLGVRPSARVLGVLLGLPLFSVSTLAWVTGNPFNGTFFAMAGVAAMTVAIRAPERNVRPSVRWAVIMGALLLSFGWVYPHFLATGSFLTYLYAAPLGLIPCPTLSAVIGLGLVFGGLASRAWSLIMGVTGAFYGIFGAVRLGVSLDWVLMAGSVALVAAVAVKPGGRSSFAARD